MTNLDHLGRKTAPNVERYDFREQLSRLAKAFVGENDRETFISRYAGKAESLVTKAHSLGYADDKLELIYVPANVTFQNLLNRLYALRQPKGYESIAEATYSSFLEEEMEDFGDYGIGDEPQLVLMVNGDGMNGLWTIWKNLGKKIAEKPKGLDFLTPAAYICANIVRTTNGGSGSIDLLDINNGIWTSTRFPQCGSDDDVFCDYSGVRFSMK